MNIQSLALKIYRVVAYKESWTWHRIANGENPVITPTIGDTIDWCRQQKAYQKQWPKQPLPAHLLSIHDEKDYKDAGITKGCRSARGKLSTMNTENERQIRLIYIN